MALSGAWGRMGADLGVEVATGQTAGTGSEDDRKPADITRR
jgi:hypothetical protein